MKEERPVGAVEGSCQFDGQGEGLASPHNQLLAWDFFGAVFKVVGLEVEVDFLKDWETWQKHANISKVNIKVSKTQNTLF